MPTLDIFNSDPFSITTLAASINAIPFRPGKIGQLGLFRERGIATTAMAFERVGTTLMLVPTSARGGPPATQPRDRRNLFDIRAPRLALQDSVLADEVQNLRAFGSETELQSVLGLVNTRLETMALHLDQTLEWHRMGAIKGVVLDADGVSEVNNLYTLQGVSPRAEIDMDLDNAGAASGALRRKMGDIVRAIEDELGGVPYTGVYGFAGRNYMDDLVSHKEYVATYQAADAARLRDRAVGIEVSVGGVTTVEYPGKVNNVTFIDDNKAVYFPIGVPDLFQTVFAPADYEETVNTLGLPRYAKQWGDNGPNRLRHLEAQSNPINFCSRPRAVQTARRT